METETALLFNTKVGQSDSVSDSDSNTKVGQSESVSDSGSISISKTKKIMKKTLTLLLLLTFTIGVFAQGDFVGFYTMNIEKDDYKGTLQAKVTKVDGTYWGKLRGFGNEGFGPSWEVDFWTLIGEGDGALNCYYDRGNDFKFPMANTLLFSLIGSKDKLETTAGASLEQAVENLTYKNQFFYDKDRSAFDAASTPAPLSAFEGTTTATPQTTAPPKPTKSQPISNTEVASTMKVPSLGGAVRSEDVEDLILGGWNGDVASEMTKFFDYEFMLNGYGTRDYENFFWTLNRADGANYIDIQFIDLIDLDTYNKYLNEAGSFQNIEGIVTFQLNNATKKIKIVNGNYYELGKTQRLKVEAISSNKLVFSFNYGGRTIKTIHLK
jgi:hypothetical protein